MKRLGRVIATSAVLIVLPTSLLGPVSAAAETGPPTAVTTFPTLKDVGISWAPPGNADPAPDGYEVERKRPSGNWAGESGRLAATVTRWIDRNVQPGATVEYRVVALYADGLRSPSASVTATRPSEDPTVGEVDALIVDADRGGSPTWLTDEIAKPVTQPGGGTLSAGTIQITVPAILPGPGTYAVGPTSRLLRLSQGAESCALTGTLTVTDLAYTEDLRIATMAARFSGGSCNSATSVVGEIRVKSSKPYAALSIDAPRIDLGRVLAHSETKRQVIAVKNIGLTEIRVSPDLSADSSDWQLSTQTCPPLAVGASCEVTVTYHPTQSGDDRAKVILRDTTARAQHHVALTASAVGSPSAPRDLKVTSTFGGVDVSWTPPFDSGNTSRVAYVLHRGGRAPEATFRLPPEQHRWTEPHVGQAGAAAYRVSAVNEIGEGPVGPWVDSRAPHQQIAVVAGRTGESTKLGSLAVSGASQVVPLGGDSLEVTGSPDGRSVAFTRTEGADQSLWIQMVAGPAGDARRLWVARAIHDPAWARDNTRIAFSTTDGPVPCVDVLTIAGGNPVRVGCNIDSPTWHPDARTLIVRDLRVTGAPLTRVQARANGARVAILAGSYGATKPVASPRGDLIAFVPKPEANGDQRVGLLPVGGGTPRLSLAYPRTIKALSWSPNGAEIAVLVRHKLSDADLVSRFQNVGDEWPAPEDYVYRTGEGEHIADLAWHGLSPTIPPTPAVVGPAVSIPFDVSAVSSFGTVCTLGPRYQNPCASPFRATGLTSGEHRFTVTASDGRGTAARVFTVDATGPSTSVVSPTYPVTLAGSALVRYAGVDPSGVASYDVRYRRAHYNGAFGGYVQPWTGVRTTSVTVGLAPGYEYCVSARARDTFGNIGAWSPDRCFSRPVDNRSLFASAGWSRQTSSLLYLGTGTSTGTYGASLARTLQAKRFYVVATRCPTCGLASVYLGTRYITAINLYAPTTQRQALIALPVQASVFTGTLRITARSRAKLIQIDGLATRRT